jgi:hypothetical protein
LPQQTVSPLWFRAGYRTYEVLVACPMVLDQEPRLFGLDIADIEGKLEHRIVSHGYG